MSPWGYTTTLPPDFTQQNQLMRECSLAIESVHGTKYEYGSSARVIYIASGGADDWTYAALGVVYSYTVELRDTGRYGFLLPATQIIPTGEETYEGLRVFLKSVK